MSYISDALVAVKLNSELNNIDSSHLTSDNLIGKELEDIDVILVGDLLYDEEFGDSVLRWLFYLHEK